jgi:hypothetical protein
MYARALATTMSSFAPLPENVLCVWPPCTHDRHTTQPMTNSRVSPHRYLSVCHCAAVQPRSCTSPILPCVHKPGHERYGSQCRTLAQVMQK